ncbi:hypothetical protein BRYFOR_05882 [Marvinbryantia formatexigens DSM 14469]|uniref:Uncharacterized protein n=1 Tax=Marvinbryantia formatexigens DSM 14469 TaxID=478749 RepID=C6LB87_9FIRM|nr:hypothetical protein BRYFOR_05882 [Marvinbryantia formatexigens DSM 14469]
MRSYLKTYRFIYGDFEADSRGPSHFLTCKKWCRGPKKVFYACMRT